MNLHEHALHLGRFQIGTELGLCRVTLPSPRIPGVICPDRVGYGHTVDEAVAHAKGEVDPFMIPIFVDGERRGRRR